MSRLKKPTTALVRCVQTSTQTQLPQIKPIKFTPLKDKASLIQQFHRDKSIPFNILRDVLRVPQFSPTAEGDVYEAWLSYVNMGDVGILQEAIGSDDDFWLKTIRVAVSTPQILHPMFQLYGPENTRIGLEIPEDLPEMMCAGLLYHGKEEFATYISDRFLNGKEELNWKPLINLALASEDPMGIHFLSKLYNNSIKNHYIPITSHLRTLNLRPSLPQHWSNLLLSQGDFPRDSSSHLNPDFESKLKSQNMKSFQSALRFLSSHEIPSDWLTDDTAYLFAIYISKLPDPDQEAELRKVLAYFKGQTFGVQFWKTLYKLSSIRLKLLDSLTKKFGQSANDPVILKAKGRRILDTRPKDFWDFVKKHSNNDVLLASISPLIMTKIIRSSNDLSRALEFTKPIILNTQNKKSRNAVIKSFITEVTKRITSKKLYHHVKVLQRFEVFLKENNLFSEEVDNYFIYADSQLLRFTSTIDRLNALLDQDAATIEPGTVDSIVQKFFKHDDLLMKRVVFDSYNETPTYQVLKLILRCHSHCPGQFKPITWGRIFNEVGHQFEMNQTRQFILEITKRVIEADKQILTNTQASENGLRIIFSDPLLRKILYWGFTKDKENPWTGFELLKELEKMGVYIPSKLLKTQLLRYVRILHRVPGMEIPKKLEMDVPLHDIQSTVKTLNKISRS